MLTKDELHAELTRRVIEQLEQGISPWAKPWDANGFSPMNAVTRHRYTGVNSMWLSLVAEWKGYDSALWVTYKGAQELGGHVAKGQKSAEILKPTIYKQKFENGKWSNVAKNELVPASVRTRNQVFYAPIPVWNVAQCEGIEIPASLSTKREPVEVLPGVEEILKRYENAPSLFHKEGDRAFYNPASDSITLPSLEQFTSASAYAETIAHEIIHSTGHESRLNRWKEEEKFTRHGDVNYSKEELVAELGCVTLLHSVGVEVELDNHATYLAGWLRPLNKDPKFLVDALEKAGRAVERVLGKVEEKEEVTV